VVPSGVVAKNRCCGGVAVRERVGEVVCFYAAVGPTFS
jgi:hypothetical protein